MCIDNVYCGKILEVIFLEMFFRNRVYEEILERFLRGGKSYYLVLWNNEDLYGDIWLINK